MRIVFATNNRHKLEEVSAILGPDFELATPASLGITEDIPETQTTLEGNALQKARYLAGRISELARATDGAGATCGLCGSGVSVSPDGCDEPVAAIFADDTGLEVTALGGAPGVRSARYAADAGEAPEGSHDFAANNRLLLRNLQGTADRSARFRTVIALIVAGDRPREYLFEGRVEGRIIEEYRGEGGFGYDPVFVPEEGSLTFAEMSPEQKNAVSHRARAVAKLNEFLKQQL